MNPNDEHPLARELAEEIENFQEIARYLNPSPGEIPELEGIDIAGLSMPFREVIGGDHIIYIDFKRRYDLERRITRARARGRTKVARNLEQLKRRAGILLADVSGHRMTDALIGAMLHQAFLVGCYYELDRYGEITTRVFEHLNTRFYRTTAVNKYFTMLYGEITSGGQFRFISAGHQPPAIFSREFGKFVKVGRDQIVSFPPVGLLPSGNDDDTDDPVDTVLQGKKRYEVNQVRLLTPGDLLLLSTDGLAEHGGGNFIGDVLEGVIREAGGEDAASICGRIEEAVLKHGKPEDDVSAVVVKRTG
jgi:serine phosphatase RsbU (regulator of sigma subunit)